MSKKVSSLEQIVAICKRRGFVYPSSQIYGGFAAVYDYGPYGVQVVNNIKNEWWRAMVQMQDNVVGLDSAIFMNPKIWKASGHVSGFADPLAECKGCNSRVRVDHLLNEIGVVADEKMTEEEIGQLFLQKKLELKCPNCGQNNFSSVKKFNLLVESNLGNFAGDLDKSPVYLRGETCQGIYINFRNVLDSNRVKIPFGIAQIGKVFRNEITARQFIFRTREFEQMELEYFVSPDKELEEYESLKQLRWNYYKALGFAEENLRWHQHEKLVFYAKEAYDIEYRFPFGFDELEGIHSRGDYDLTQHSKHSGANLTYFDPQSNERFVPHIVESSVGVGRTFLALMCEAYNEESVGEEERIVLKFPIFISPVKIAVLPLFRNKPELVEIAKKIHNTLKSSYVCEFDDQGSIGKRYRRQDEIGTPFCLTVDYSAVEDGMVTVRDRDTMQQDRIPIEQVSRYFEEKFRRT